MALIGEKGSVADMLAVGKGDGFAEARCRSI
jgi:hypothetical protein